MVQSKAGKKRFRKRNPKKKLNVDKRQNKTIKMLKRAVNADIRYNQIVLGTSRLSSTAGVASLLNGMVTGTIDGTRSGNAIRIKNIKLNIEIWNDANAGAVTGPAGTFVRAMIVYDKETNATTFATADLLDNNGANANNYFAIPSFINRKRFKILYDNIVDIRIGDNTRAAAAGTQYEYQSHMLRIDQNVDLPTQYIAGAGAGTVADIELGALYLVVWPETNNTCQYSYRAMIQYSP